MTKVIVSPEDIPCRVTVEGLSPHSGRWETMCYHYRDTSLINLNYRIIDGEYKKRIKKTLTRQGWFRKLILDDDGEIIAEITVKPCPVKDWHKRGE